MLRAYAKYMRQGGTPFAQHSIEDALRRNIDIAAALVALFEARFDPAPNGDAGRGPRRGDRRADPAPSTTSRASMTTASCGPT